MTTLPSLATLPPVDQHRGADPTLVKAELLDVIRHAITTHPRSQQKAIGPSEVGSPCPRKLAYKFADIEPVNIREPAWKPTVGTAVHTWLEETFTEANRGSTVARWLCETRLDVGEIAGQPVLGSCDLYDRVTATVIDFKVLGVASLRDKRANGPGQLYRTQAHLYGRGWTRRGLPVDTVALLCLPQNGELGEAYYWHEPYDAQIAVDALARADGIARLAAALGPQAAATLPTADAWCSYCPWHQPGSTDLTRACPGDESRPTKADQFTGLIAPRDSQTAKEPAA